MPIRQQQQQVTLKHPANDSQIANFDNNICYSVRRAPTLPSNLSINTEKGEERQGGKKQGKKRNL